MIGRGVIIAAAATYLVVVGCVMWPADSAPRVEGDAGDGAHASDATTHSFVGAVEDVPRDAGPRDKSNANGARDATRPAPPRARPNGLPFCGVAMQIQRIDLIKEYEKNIDE